MADQPPKPSTTETGNAQAAAGTATEKKEALPVLQPLEEDDEFEEFEAEDWPESETFAGKLNAAAGDGQAQGKGLDSLWEDNWDDDDIEDDWSVQLRGELQKQDQMQT